MTGACYLLETAGVKILIDCGLFQGAHEVDGANATPFSFPVADIDALAVTHAHIDHIGRIPKLVHEGFRGVIYSTAATRDLALPLLEDALRLAEREGQSLYTKKDVEKAFALWREMPYGAAQTIGDIPVTLRNAGHILGSAMVEIRAEEKKILFTGDLGNHPSVLLPPPDAVRDAAYLVIESAYGDRAHEAPEDRVLLLERVVEDAVARGGTLVIPAFATERTQDILYLLNGMLLFRRIPDVPVFVDSPLAIRITDVYERYPQEYRPEIRELFGKHPKLFRFKKLRFTADAEESKAIAGVQGPKIVIAGSGMMQGGRVLHHLRHYLPDRRSILLIVGFQAAGSLGRRLIEGADRVNIFGEDVAVRAEVRKINGFSAHADAPQLLAFVEQNRDTLKRVFVVQGEDAPAEALAQAVRDRLGIPAVAPRLRDTVEI
ncbi:MAG: metallo-beta-lactamase family protein [Parcubacteria group bacterium Greene0714_36]|nr:MAG: metallo-beta-lactamase family protein [Parcubacteria group bacterium Greene0714_36]